MRFVWIAVLTFGMMAVRASADTTTAAAPKDSKPTTEKATTLKTQMDKVSYCIGVQIAKSMQQDGIDINVEMLAKAMKDVFSSGKLLMTDEEMQKTMAQLTSDLRQKQAQAQAAAGEKNKKDGDAFLAENKKREGVITLPSGLQYKIVKAGSGKKPTASDSVECNYRGTTIDGKEFDSSARHGGPATFTVGGVIAGWTEALQLMPVGSKWQLFIPSNLAYGDTGNGPDIGPNAVLVFDIELLGIK